VSSNLTDEPIFELNSFPSETPPTAADLPSLYVLRIFSAFVLETTPIFGVAPAGDFPQTLVAKT